MRAYRPFALLLLCTVMGAFVPSPSRADAPGDMYFDGFKLMKEAETHVKEGNNTLALQKYLKVEEKITNVQLLYPGWQSDVVTYRLKLIQKAIKTLQASDTQSDNSGSSPPLVLPPAVTTPPARPDLPPMRTIPPPPEYLQRPKVPFTFNGNTYYKMLLSNRPTSSVGGR